MRAERPRTWRARDHGGEFQRLLASSATWSSSAPAPAARSSRASSPRRATPWCSLEEGDSTAREFTGRAVEMQRKLYRDRARRSRSATWSIPIPLGRTVGGTTRSTRAPASARPIACCAIGGREFGLDELAPEQMARHFDRVEEVLGVAPAATKYLGGVAASSPAAATRSATRISRCAATRPSATARACAASAAPPTRSARPTSATCRSRSGPARSCSPGCAPNASWSTAVAPSAWWLRTQRRRLEAHADGARARRRRRLRLAPDAAAPRARAVGTTLGTARAEPLDPSRARRHGALRREASTVATPSRRATPSSSSTTRASSSRAPSCRSTWPLRVHHDRPALRRARQSLRSHRLLRLDDRGRLARPRAPRSRWARRSSPTGSSTTTWRGSSAPSRSWGGSTSPPARAASFRWCTASTSSTGPPISSGCVTPSCARATSRSAPITRSAPRAWDAMRDAVVVGADHQVHDTPGCYVVDGSVVPSSPAVNPQVTIMALATRAAGGDRRGLS